MSNTCNIYTDIISDGTNHYYSSLQLQDRTGLPEYSNLKTINTHTRSKVSFRRSRVYWISIIALAVVLLMSLCSLYIGYVLGKRAGEEQRIEQNSDNTKLKPATNPQLSTITSGTVTVTSSGGQTSSTGVLTSSLTGTPVFPTFAVSNTTDVQLEGKNFRISRYEDDRHWHYDACCHKYVSGIWQPLDEFTQFAFVKMPDESFKIMSVEQRVYNFDGYDVKGAQSEYLNGMDKTDDDHMRFIVSMDTANLYRIQTKATGRFVRMDPDLRVSTRFNIIDNCSLFTFTEIN